MNILFSGSSEICKSLANIPKRQLVEKCFITISGMHVRNYYDKNASIRYDIRTVEMYAKTALTPFNNFYNSYSDYIKPYI